MTHKRTKHLNIATRASPLALWQAQHVQLLLHHVHPHIQTTLLPLTTAGDQSFTRPLGKGLFVKELQHALLDGRADLAVHSLKDVPAALDQRFSIAATPRRGSPLDAFISPRYRLLAHMPAGSVVGTSSVRRSCQIQHQYPHLSCRPVRGNLQTRLRKLEEGECDALVLAAAGLERLNLGSKINQCLSVDAMLPAPAQGAIGVEIAAANRALNELLQPINDPATFAATTLERSCGRALKANCDTPFAAFAHHDGNTICLRALIGARDGSVILHAEEQAAAACSSTLGVLVAEKLIRRGGGKFI